MDDATYVRRRRWSADEKRAVVAEALSSGNVIATAKRHAIQAQQIYRWRERLEGMRCSQATALAVGVAGKAQGSSSSRRLLGWSSTMRVITSAR